MVDAACRWPRARCWRCACAATASWLGGAGRWGRDHPGHLHRGEDLVDLLEEELDDESADESERLQDALRLLRPPEWIVASGGLLRLPPTGFSRTALTRYRVGRTTVDARLEDAFVRPFRKRQAPPPIFEDPPRTAGDDGWPLWM